MRGFRIYYADGSREDYDGNDGDPALEAWIPMTKTGVELVAVLLDTPNADRGFIRGFSVYWMEIVGGKARIKTIDREHGHPRETRSTPAEDRLYVPPVDADYAKTSGPELPNSVADCKSCGERYEHIIHWPFNPKGFHEFVPYPPDAQTWTEIYQRAHEEAWVQ